jgi:ABC-type transport system involved in multi-copper enzyme maturation permease subunit
MTRLMHAELRKAVRPLVGAVALGLLLAAATFAWQQQAAASQQVAFVNSSLSSPSGIAQGAGAPQIPTCAALGLSPGPECDNAQARARQAYQSQLDAMNRQAAAGRQLVRTAAIQQSPVGAGLMASSLMASLLGAIAIFLLAAGQFGGEWTGGTIATVLTQDTRRWRLLLGKFLSLFLLAQGLLLSMWALLALLAVIFQSTYPLPGTAALSFADGFAVAGPAVAKSVLVTAVFSALGVLAAVITRNALGTLLLALGGLILWMMLVLFPSLAPLSVGYWVSGWMSFSPAGVSYGQVWSGVPAAIASPSQLLGLEGLVAVLVVAGIVSTVRFQRLDIAA